MQADTTTKQRIIEKNHQLFPEQMLQVEELMDSLDKNIQNADREITFAAAKLSEPAFQKIWHNPNDAEYDKFMNLRELSICSYTQIKRDTIVCYNRNLYPGR